MPTKIIPEIHEATVEQRSIVVDIFKASYSEYAKTSDPDFWTLYQTNTSNTLLTDDSVTRLVAHVDNKVVGSVLLCPPNDRRFGPIQFSNPYPEMRLLGILPEFRNAGIANRLIDECENRTRAAGFDAITLHTTRLMQTAKAMYERRGYVRFSEIDFQPVPDFIVWGFIKHFDRTAA
jgi:ribosomal protein S18 acetylase RimI-like enzyme